MILSRSRRLPRPPPSAAPSEDVRPATGGVRSPLPRLALLAASDLDGFVSGQRELAFAIRFGSPHANWLPIDVRLADHTEHVEASGVVAEDPVTGVVHLALLAASDLDGTATLGWWIEPAGFWLSAAISGSTARLELTFATGMHQAWSAHRTGLANGLSRPPRWTAPRSPSRYGAQSARASRLCVRPMTPAPGATSSRHGTSRR